MKKHSASSFFLLGAIMALLCALLVLPASAAADTGTLTVNLTWSGINGSTSGPANGDPVDGGYAALLEDGAQVMVGGNALTPIVNGSVSFTYAFDPAKTYSVSIQEKLDAPYYEAKTIPVTTPPAAGATVSVSDTVTYVEWSKPVTVILEDSNGNPAPLGTEVSLTATSVTNGGFDYHTATVTKPTDANGMAVFYDFSYDPNDPEMCNIHGNQILVTAKCGDTQIAQVFVLGPVTAGGRIYKYDGSGNSGSVVDSFYYPDTTIMEYSNVVTMNWPDVTVSGTVYDASGQPSANQRVAAYYGPPSTGSPHWAFCGYGDPQYSSDVLAFLFQGWVYYTTTDDNGNYSLSLPQGFIAEICVDNAALTVSGTPGSIAYMKNAVNYDYARAATDHFVYLRHILKRDDMGPTMAFCGLECLETAPVVCVPHVNMVGMDLFMGKTAYTLKANLLAAGAPYNGDLSLTLKGMRSPSPGLHKGALCDTSGSWAVTNGAVDKTDVTLAPGLYTLSIASNSNYPDYSSFIAVPVNITAADISDDGVVDLGTIDFVPVPKAPVVPRPGSPSTGIVTPSQPTAPSAGHPYVTTRMEAVADPAYGSGAYQVTLNYVGFHTNAAVNTIPSGTVSVNLPAGITVCNPGNMTLSGSTLTKSFTNLTTSQVQTEKFYVKIDDNSAQNYYILLCDSTPDYNGDMSPERTSAVTLQRLRINLSAPRLVKPGTPFKVFGDSTGAGETGIKLYNNNTLLSTGAKKGRYYYFNVPGQQAGSYLLKAVAQRDGSTETSNAVTVDVADGLPYVDDVSLEVGASKYPKNPKFDMVYYTGFVDQNTLAGPAFKVHLKLSNMPTVGFISVRVELMGLSFPAYYDSSTKEWVAEVSDYAGYGDFDLMLNIDNVYTTQIGRLLLLF